MAATVTTLETFPKTTTKVYLDEAVRLRLKAGAIGCKYVKQNDGSFLMTTIWNVIGEQ